MASNLGDYDIEAWGRLGCLLAQRRLDLGYDTFKAFVDSVNEPGFYRLAWDVEHASGLGRRRYQPISLRRIEDAYQLHRGNFVRILKGGGLEPLAGSPAPEVLPPEVQTNLDDKMVRDLWEHPRLTRESKRYLIGKYLTRRDGNGGQRQRRA